MTYQNINDVELYPADLIEHYVLFTSWRIDLSSLPEGLYKYEIRHSDTDWRKPVTVEDHVIVNFFGTIITDETLDLYLERSGIDYIPINSKKDFKMINQKTIPGDCALKYFKGEYKDDVEEV